MNEHQTDSQPVESPSSPGVDVTTVADERVHPLDPRSIGAERFGWWITTALLSGGGLVALISTWIGDPDGIALLIVAACWLMLTAVLVSPLGLEIRRGVIWRRVINLPLSRVQHTDVQQGPVQRRYGVASLVVHTAGTAAASVTLAGLSYETALRIRDFLVREGGADDGV
jgi:membrane protein YdbS with pleckstrin-like domain